MAEAFAFGRQHIAATLLQLDDADAEIRFLRDYVQGG